MIFDDPGTPVIHLFWLKMPKPLTDEGSRHDPELGQEVQRDDQACPAVIGQFGMCPLRETVDGVLPFLEEVLGEARDIMLYERDIVVPRYLLFDLRETDHILQGHLSEQCGQFRKRDIQQQTRTQYHDVLFVAALLGRRKDEATRSIQVRLPRSMIATGTPTHVQRLVQIPEGAERRGAGGGKGCEEVMEHVWDRGQPAAQCTMWSAFRPSSVVMVTSAADMATRYTFVSCLFARSRISAS